MADDHPNRIVGCKTTFNSLKIYNVSHQLYIYMTLDIYWPELTHTTTTTLHPFNSLFSRTTWEASTQKGKTSLYLNYAWDYGVLGWQWHHLDHMQTICTSLQTDNHTNTSPPIFLQAGCSSWHPTNSVKAVKVAHTWRCCYWLWRWCVVYYARYRLTKMSLQSDWKWRRSMDCVRPFV